MTKIVVVGEAWGEDCILVDPEDFECVSQFNWSVMVRKHHARHVYRKVDRTQTIFLHHFILGFVPKHPMRVDHKDRNGLNNSRQNLRVVTPRINALNSVRSDKAKGVERHGNRFRVRPFVNGSRVNLGSFKTEEEAQAVWEAYKCQRL